MSNNIPVLFVTADLAVSYGEIYAAGRSGGCGLPVATAWRIDPESVRPATDAERVEHAALIAEMTTDVQSSRKFDRDGGHWYIASDTMLIHARIGYPVTARDRLQSSMSGLSMVPPLVRRLFESLIGNNPSQRNTAVKSAGELRDEERGLLFDLLEQNIQQKPSDKSSYDAFRALVEKDVSESAERLASAIDKAPESKIPAAVGTDIDTLCKSKQALYSVFTPILNKWEKSDTRVGGAVKSVRKPRQTGI